MLTTSNSVEINEVPLPPKIKGLYIDGAIYIKKGIKTTAEKESIIAEELGHHYTTQGNILDQKNGNAAKQEETARRWSYEYKVPLESFVEAHNRRLDHFDMIEDLGITEEFFNRALDYYKAKFGNFTTCGDYIIYFDPLGVMELKEEKEEKCQRQL